MNATGSATSPPRWLRFAELAIIASVVFGCAWIGYRQWSAASQEYAASHPLEIAYKKMYTTIRNGDSIEQLESHFGPGEVLNRDTTPDWLLKHAHTWPEGCQDGDQFVRWKIGATTLHFQFRNGRLINHNPADYADPDEMIKLIQPMA